MPKSIESKIEDFAFNHLETHYTTLYSLKGILVSKNEKTKQGSTADGIFAFNQKDKSYFIASLNLSQSEKLSALLVNYKKNGLSKFRLLTALTAGIAAAFLGKSIGHWAVIWIAPIVAAIAVFTLHTLFEKKRLYKKVESAVDILKLQPADEQWLGLSISSLCFRNNSLAKHLLQICERRGIGIITVGKRAKVIHMLEPRTATCRKGDFISYYVSEEKIRKALQGDSYLRVA